MGKIIDVNKKQKLKINKEVTRILKRDNYNGVHTLIGLINSFQKVNMSDQEIIENLKRI